MENTHITKCNKCCYFQKNKAIFVKQNFRQQIDQKPNETSKTKETVR